MSKNNYSQNIFDQVALQNSAIAENLEQIASRSREYKKETSSANEIGFPISPSISRSEVGSQVLYQLRARQAIRYSSRLSGTIAFIFGITLLGFAIGPTIYNLVLANWKTILLTMSGIFIGSGLILFMGNINKKPLKNIEPLNSSSEEPLTELEKLATRSVSRLRTAYRLQIILICVVAVIIFSIVIWSIIMVTQNQLVYATFFGSSGISMIILSKWKWQPFERVSQARKLADDADILATGLRIRIQTISEIPDPKERAHAQWQAVTEYLDKS